MGPVDTAGRYFVALESIPWSQVHSYAFIEYERPQFVDARRLKWEFNLDYDKRWEEFSISCKQPLLSGEDVSLRQGATAREAARQFVNRLTSPSNTLLDAKQLETLRELLDWNPELEPDRQFPLVRRMQPARLTSSVVRQHSGFLQQFDWSTFDLPRGLKQALSSGTATSSQCSEALTAIDSSSKKGSRNKRQSKDCETLANIMLEKENKPISMTGTGAGRMTPASSDDLSALVDKAPSPPSDDVLREAPQAKEKKHPSSLTEEEKLSKLEELPPSPKQDPSSLTEEEKIRKLKELPPSPKQDPSSLTEEEKIRKLKELPPSPKQDPSSLTEEEKIRKLKQLPPPPRQDPSPPTERLHQSSKGSILGAPREENIVKLADGIAEKKFSEFMQKLKLRRTILDEKKWTIPQLRAHFKTQSLAKAQLWVGKWGWAPLAIAALPLYIREVVEVFKEERSALEQAAVTTSILPIIGCSVQAASDREQGSAVPASTTLCYVADGLLFTPFAPIGLIVQLFKGIVRMIELQNDVNIRTRHDKGWDSYYQELFNHFASEKWKSKLELAYSSEIAAISFAISEKTGMLEAGKIISLQNATTNEERRQIDHLVSQGELEEGSMKLCDIILRKKYQFERELPGRSWLRRQAINYSNEFVKNHESMAWSLYNEFVSTRTFFTEAQDISYRKAFEDSITPISDRIQSSNAWEKARVKVDGFVQHVKFHAGQVLTIPPGCSCPDDISKLTDIASTDCINELESKSQRLML
ncbi:hypothetical protein CDD81_2665 [Ophiocordyceps australis]|uniref:Uncharacterized protein n=1 Tax=Ophiocordyceps australis TaxID=1399860 RepID=A0A2C5XWC5_9HYPO|nr:hypothetical protein CDD81_2665 [Ophiocordyceps australis]